MRRRRRRRRRCEEKWEALYARKAVHGFRLDLRGHAVGADDGLVMAPRRQLQESHQLCRT